jgi:hypothetical protein
MKTIGVREHCVALLKHHDRVSSSTGDTSRRCPGWPWRGSRYCYCHDPSITKEQRRANAVKGGQAGRGKRRFRLGTPGGIKRALALAWNAFCAVDRTSEDGDERALLLLIRLVRAQVAGWKAAHAKAASLKDAGPRAVRIIYSE